MHGNEKCLTSEEMDLLLWAAQNGAFLSSPEHQEFEIICQLVESGHLFHGQPMNSVDAAATHYSITKKGFAVLQCNFLWNVYDETSAHQHVVAHVNECRLDCNQACLHDKKMHINNTIKISSQITNNNGEPVKVIE